jgi:hypothetical protein
VEKIDIGRTTVLVMRLYGDGAISNAAQDAEGTAGYAGVSVSNPSHDYLF